MLLKTLKMKWIKNILNYRYIRKEYSMQIFQSLYENGEFQKSNLFRRVYTKIIQTINLLINTNSISSFCKNLEETKVIVVKTIAIIPLASTS